MTVGGRRLCFEQELDIRLCDWCFANRKGRSCNSSFCGMPRRMQGLHVVISILLEDWIVNFLGDGCHYTVDGWMLLFHVIHLET